MYLNFRLGKRNLWLGIAVIFLVSLTLTLMDWTTRSKRLLISWLQSPSAVIMDPENSKWRDQPIRPALAKCQRLKRFFEMGNWSEKSVPLHSTAGDDNLIPDLRKLPVEGEDRKVLLHLLLMQECPWQPNNTALAQYRAELGRCCNASFLLALTKKNTRLGSEILLDGNKGKTLPVKAKLMDLLPERSPISGILYDQCAVVGNGGILRNSSCGEEIDQADLIVRFNMAPMNYSEDVGTKTSLLTINPSILLLKYQKLQARRKPFVDALRPYGDSLFFIPAFSFVGHSNLGYNALYTMEDFGMVRRGYFLNPHYMSALEIYWESRGFRPRRLSSGFMLVNVALEFCQRVTLYGFWPFSHDPASRLIPHHYYDDRPPKPGIHAMNDEFSHYLKMYAQGVLRLRLGKCQ